MGLKRSLADASYWMYDRMRHKAAFESAGEPGTASDFAGLHGHKYALLVTFRKNGTAVPTPVWFALLDDRRLVVQTEKRTAKVQRIRRDPRARVFPCDPRGKPLGPGVDGTAQILASAPDCELAEAALDRHYGRTRRIYEKLMGGEGGMVYLEVAPTARQRSSHDWAATRHERAARGEREAAEVSDMFSDAAAAERHREAARELEHGADDERHKANEDR
jgi:uncharacterized protein